MGQYVVRATLILQDWVIILDDDRLHRSKACERSFLEFQKMGTVRSSSFGVDDYGRTNVHLSLLLPLSYL